MVERVEEQGAHPDSRSFLGFLGLFRPHGRSGRFPPANIFFLGRGRVFCGAWIGSRLPWGCPAVEVGDGPRPTSFFRPLIRWGPYFFFGGGVFSLLASVIEYDFFSEIRRGEC